MADRERNPQPNSGRWRLAAALAVLATTVGACTSGETTSPTADLEPVLEATTSPPESTTTIPTTTTTVVPEGVVVVSTEPIEGVERQHRSIQAAVDAAGQGEEVWIAGGAYEPFEIQRRSGLTIRRWHDDDPVIISSRSLDTGAGILIREAADITVIGLTVEESLWGVVAQRASGVRLAQLQVHTIGQEAIHIQEYSVDVIIEDCAISDTGLRPGGDGPFGFSTYGEGIYLGTGSTPPGEWDTTSSIIVRNNRIARTTSEAIDVKPSVSDVLIENNLIHDVTTNTSGAITVGVGDRVYPEPSVVIRNNMIWNIETSSPHTDGNAITLSAAATVERNLIWSTQHHGVLADGNFVNADARTVTISENIFLFTGLAGFEAWESPSPATVEEQGNLTEIDGVLEPTDLVADGEPTPLAFELLAGLG